MLVKGAPADLVMGGVTKVPFLNFLGVNIYAITESYFIFSGPPGETF